MSFGGGERVKICLAIPEKHVSGATATGHITVIMMLYGHRTERMAMVRPRRRRRQKEDGHVHLPGGAGIVATFALITYTHTHTHTHEETETDVARPPRLLCAHSIII